MERLKLFAADDNTVDRRLVVKLIITYFDRNENVLLCEVFPV